jgi:hypothetical protein
MIKKKPEALTLDELSVRYLRSLERGGWSLGTCFSYAQEMKLAQDELGKDTLISAITPAQVQKYFASARVNKLRNGKPKAQVSVLKTQRVLRLALVWAAEQGLIEVEALDARAGEDVASKSFEEQQPEVHESIHSWMVSVPGLPPKPAPEDKPAKRYTSNPLANEHYANGRVQRFVASGTSNSRHASVAVTASIAMFPPEMAMTW